MKITAVGLAVALALPLYAGRHRALVPADRISIEFVDVPSVDTTLTTAGSDGWLDVKALKPQGGSKVRSVGVRRQFGIRILRSGGATFGAARVTARLSAPDPRSSYRIDGRSLTTTALVIDPHVAIGTLTVHTLEIEVSDSAAPGPLLGTISWEASTL